MKQANKDLTPELQNNLLKILKARFEKNMYRHVGLVWAKIQTKLEASSEKL